MRNFNFLLLAIIMTVTHPLNGSSIGVTNAYGERFLIEVPSNATLLEIQETIEEVEGTLIEAQRLDIQRNKTPEDLELTVAQKSLRNYARGYTSQEAKDIHFVVTNLGRGKANALSHFSSLNKAGDRIDNVHPLRFLECIFTNEECKAGIANIQKSGGFVAKKFNSGLFNTLTEEANAGNIPRSYVAGLASALSLDVKVLLPFFKNNNWQGLVNTLIAKVPRDSRANMFDM